MYTIDNLSSLNFTINFECAFYSIMYIDKKEKDTIKSKDNKNSIIFVSHINILYRKFS